MENTIQKQFFEALKSFIPSNLSVAEEVSNTLAVSLDTAYRRMRGESVLSLDEALILCKTYNMPLGVLLKGESNVVSFLVNQLTNQRESFEDYLQKMGDDVERVSKFENKHIVYAAEDIPMFYHFLSKGLASFKIFYWMKAIQNVEDMDNTVYSPDMFGDMFETHAKRIIQHYSVVPTTEIWTSETIESTLTQIRFFWDAGFIPEKAHGIQVCDELKDLISHIKKQVELGEKLKPDGTQTGQSFTFYMSDLMIGTNCVLCKIGDKRVSYLSYNSFNSMKTSNDFFADQSESWLNNLMSKSMLISGVAEKQRNQFFKMLFSKIEELKTYIEND